jgi:hypothetical protein
VVDREAEKDQPPMDADGKAEVKPPMDTDKHRCSRSRIAALAGKMLDR